MKAQTTVSNLTQCGLSISGYKKYTVSGVTFYFNAFMFLSPRTKNKDLIEYTS